MKNYIEISILDCDINSNFVLSKIYSIIHGFLSRKKMNNVGISFPEYNKKGLGKKIRLFCDDKSALEEFRNQKQLLGGMDYYKISSVREVPEKIKGYGVFKRSTAKSKRNKALRYSKRHGVSFAESMAFFSKDKQTNKPYVILKSKSTNNRFSLFISKKEFTNKKIGIFSEYGLSSDATVPLF